MEMRMPCLCALDRDDRQRFRTLREPLRRARNRVGLVDRPPRTACGMTVGRLDKTVVRNQVAGLGGHHG
jgi:hypothetical protein